MKRQLKQINQTFAAALAWNSIVLEKDRSVSGKAARRQRIKERHAVIIGTKVIVEEQP